MEADPISQFFPEGEGEEDILYTTLGVTRDSTAADITKAYRKGALRHHPDKHAHATEEVRAAEAMIFQQVGYAYAVLKDDNRRKRYDETGRTDERSFLEEGTAAGWEAYFAETFERVTRSKLDEIKAAYQGSDEERLDVYEAYRSHDGALPAMLEDIMCATTADESRFKTIVEEAISAGTLKRSVIWTQSAADGKAAKKRAAAERKEAREAEEHAKEIGVWDEFYGSGKATESKKGSKPKGKGKASADDDEDADLAGLKALIRKRGSDRASNTIASIEARAQAAAGKKGRKEKQFAPPAEIDDAEFERIQKELVQRAAEAKKRPAPTASAGGKSSAPKRKKK